MYLVSILIINILKFWLKVIKITIKVTIKNLEVLSMDQENNLLMVKGAVPGSTGTLLYAKKSRKQ